ncbi:MAG: hypothetical protein HY548_09980 [Elusimicrobia bacterium]|nr:hypothetical protein [Elusimicrobiota bacterium]
MSTMSGSDFRDYIVRTFKRTDKDTEIYEAITDALMDMRLKFQFDDFKVETYSAAIDAAGEYKFDAPTNLGHIISVRVLDDDDSYPLVKLSKSQFDEFYPNPNYSSVDTDKPRHYCYFGGQFLLGPVPDLTSYQYEISHAKEDETAVTSGTSAVDFTDRYREAVKEGVLERLYASLGDWEEASLWNSLYEARMAAIIKKEKENSQGPTQVAYNDL